MKKQLLSLVAAAAVISVSAQTPSPQWTINQQAIFPSSPTFTAPGIKFIDAVDTNVIWTVGMDWADTDRNYNWYSRSLNGGTTFTGGNIFSDTSTYQIANLEGIDANTAWVASFMKGTQSQGAIHRTTNGGQTWINMTGAGMFTNTAAFTNFVSFVTPSIGIANGDPVNGEFELWRTTNGGLSWTQVAANNIPNPLTGEFAIVDLYTKLGTSNYWFGTNAGRMYRSTDAGITWSVATVGSTSDVLLEIAFTTPLRGITYVSNGASVDVYNTTDGGATWNMIFPTGNIGLADVVNIPGTGVLASFGVGANSFMSYSADNGLTWTDWNSQNIQYFTGDFVDGKHGWAGTFDMPQAPFFTNIWKYSGAAISGTTAPTSAFSLPISLCLTASTVTTTVNNSSTGSPILTYSWSSTPGGVVFSSPTASAPVLTFNAVGNYTITLKVTNGLGTNTSSQYISVVACSPPAPSFSLDPQGCTNIAMLLDNTSTAGSPAPTYSWSSTAGGNFAPSPFVNEPTFMASTPGVYTISLTGANAQGNVTTTQTVNIVSCAPQAAFTMTDVLLYCNPSYSVKPKLVATNNTSVIPSVGANSYTWSIAPSSSVQAPSYTSLNFTATIRHSSINMYTVTLKAQNGSGFTTTTHTVSVDLECVGIEENNSAQNMMMYPNPANDAVTVKMSGSDNYSLKLVNVLGAVVYSENVAKGTDVKTIDVSSMPKGVYFLTLESGAGKTSRKLIIE